MRGRSEKRVGQIHGYRQLDSAINPGNFASVIYFARPALRELAKKVDGDKNEDDRGHHFGETAETVRPDRYAMLAV